MSTKIGILNELNNILRQKEKMDEGVLFFSKQFKLGQLLKPFSTVKKQGYSLMLILVALILSRFGGLSVYAAQKTGNLQMDDNTIYRLMNNQLIDWKSILLSFAKQFIKCVSAKCESDTKSVKCFVIDDSDIEKSGKTFEGISKIFSHKKHLYLFGFKLLLLCYWDGKSLIPCCLSLHRENKKKEYGLNKKQQKRQFTKKRKDAGYFQERYEELDQEKSSVAIKMLKQCVKRGILGSYVLMDSWFVTDFMLKEIRKLRNGILHVVGMCKMDKRKFEVNGKEFNSQTIIRMNEHNSRKVHSCRKYKSRYFVVVANYKGTPVKLFYIKYKNAKNWTLLLTTDLSLSFVKAMELYQIRWSIEVLFKECKQYLRLGKSQNTDFCGQIADASMAMITYTILSLYKRFDAYETLGALFRDTQKEMLEKTLCERIEIVILKILTDLLEILSIDVVTLGYSFCTDEPTDLAIAPLLTEKLSFSEISAPLYGTLIFHPSPLPHGRGASSIKWAYKRKEPMTAATWFWANDGKIDSGDICEMEIIKIDYALQPREFYGIHVLPALERTLERALVAIAGGYIRRVPQIEAYSSFDYKL